MTTMTSRLAADPGSFRDVENRVYIKGNRVLRGVSQSALAHWTELSAQDFYKKSESRGDVIATRLLPASDPVAKAVLKDGWTGVLEHDRVPFISYPYEWSVSMLRDAALLHLRLIERAVKADWSLKDATAYNVQFIGAKPVFIDIVSFEPRKEGEPWYGYRQFCMMFLIPLMIRAHLDIDHLPMLRSNLEGISPVEASKLFRLSKGFKKGVSSHILLPAKVENSIASKERDDAEAKTRSATQKKDRIIALVQSIRRLIKKLDFGINHTTWSHYEKTHSYDDVEFQKKIDFVRRSAATDSWDTAMDIGCNTGTFSKLISPFSKLVISADGDHNAVEQLYLRENEADNVGNIMPLVMNLANPSPSQGWAGTERRALGERAKPQLILCLALIHHIAISANVPISAFLEWLRSFDSKLVIEFVTRQDDMVKKLLTNKTIDYDHYTLEIFESEVKKRFKIIDSENLKGGHRKIFFLDPK